MRWRYMQRARGEGFAFDEKFTLGLLLVWTLLATIGFGALGPLFVRSLGGFMKSIFDSFNASLRLMALSGLIAFSMTGPVSAKSFDVVLGSDSLAPAWVPDGRADGSTITEVSGNVKGWGVKATFAWMTVQGRPSWQLLTSKVTYGVTASLTGKSGETIASEPVVPTDPNPPTQPPPGGSGTATSEFWENGWSYKIVYIWGVRNGVLGWHVQSIEATFRPNPPKPIIQ